MTEDIEKNKFNAFSLEELKIIWSGLSWRISEVNEGNEPYEKMKDEIFEVARKLGVNDWSEMDF